MLASKAHVKIGSIEYLLDESVEEPYNYVAAGQYDPNSSIPGGQGARSIRGDRALWMMTDWSGGEGNRVWYPDQPTRYDFATDINSRIPGQITGRPTVASTSKTVTDQQKPCFLTIGGGSLWLSGSIETFESTDASTFTSRSNGLTAGTARRITAVCGDENFIYVAAWDTASSGTRVVIRIAADGSGTTTTLESSATSKKPYMGMCVLQNNLFAWTGRKLYQFDLNQSFPLTAVKVYDTGVDLSPDAGGTQWWADCVPGTNSVFFFVGSDGMTQVYEARSNSDGVFITTPIWTLPYGFTTKDLRYQNNTLYASGHWGTENAAGDGGAYALRMDTLQEKFAGWFRKQAATNLQMQQTANSYGKQVLLAAARTGRVFVYDGDFNAISLIHDLESGDSFTDNDHRIGALMTYGPYRCAAVYRPGAAGTTHKVYRWLSDEPGNRETAAGATGTLTMGEWDYDLPFETKVLDGFHVTFKPLTSNQRILIEYQIDQSGSWTTADARITSATSGNSTGRVYLPVSTTSSTVKFFRLKWRITLDNNNTGSTTLPIVYAVTAESRLMAYDEAWVIYVRTKQESNRTRPSSRQHTAEQMRDNLRSLVSSKNMVTFLDGYRSKQNGEYTTHSVYVDSISDVIKGHSEGTMRVVLRARTQ